MTERDVIEEVHEYVASQFPKECVCCGRRYDSLAEFVRDTTYAGKPMSYDAEMGDWQPDLPIGTIGMANCACGTTLAISSKDMKLTALWRLMWWGRKEAKRRGIPLRDLLAELRSKIDERVLLSEGEATEASGLSNT